ncbi:MAG: hypothetical protein AAFQ15_04820 [Pseudomonadota bacterium]
MALPRLRQLVFASHEANDVERLRHILDLGPGFVDPGVAVFGLTNGVFALGDQFLEVVVPVEERTAAGRFLDRSQGLGGYMAIFQTDDLARIRSHADANGLRRVWDIDVEDISASHLHPADMGAAIVSIDEARPAGSWRWGGPDWQGNSAPGALLDLEVTAADSETLAARWGGVLDVSPKAIGHDVWELGLSEGVVRVIPGDRDYLSKYTLIHPEPGACLERARQAGLSIQGTSFLFAGVQIALLTD